MRALEHSVTIDKSEIKREIKSDRPKISSDANFRRNFHENRRGKKENSRSGMQCRK